MQNHPVADPEITNEKGKGLEILAITCRDNNVLGWFPLDSWVLSSFSLPTRAISDIVATTLSIRSELCDP